MTLMDANIGEEYIIKNIATDDEELNSFLFSLGCYSGEPITVVSRKRRNCTVSIKDARYNIDNELAAAITIQAAAKMVTQFTIFYTKWLVATNKKNGGFYENCFNR